MNHITEEKESQEKKPRGKSLQKLGSFLAWIVQDQWFLIAIAIVIVIASQVQVPSQHQELKQVLVSYLADTRILLVNYSKWKQHIFIQLQSFLMVSALAFAIVSLAATNRSFMDPWLLIGLIFNACQPTTMASNVMFTTQAHGNAALTVVETTIGNFLGPFLSPLLIKLYLSAGDWYTSVIPPQHGGYPSLYARTFKQFGLSIYLPMVVGQVVRYFFLDAVRCAFGKWKLSKVGSCCLLAMLWQTFDHAFETRAFQSARASNLVFIVFITIVNFAIWLTICVALSLLWLDRKDTVSVAMCVPAKTLALGLPLSFLLFENISPLDEGKIQVPLVIFQVMQMSMASLSTLAFRRWVDAGERKARQMDDEQSSSGGSTPTTPTKSQSGCLCRALQFEIAADTEPIYNVICHCDNCKKSSGSPFLCSSIFPKEAFRVTAGQAQEYTDDRTDSGKPLYRYFCGTCGSSLYATTPLADGIISVFSGCIDDVDRWWTPNKEQFIQTKSHWLPDFEVDAKEGVTERHDRNPVV